MVLAVAKPPFTVATNNLLPLFLLIIVKYVLDQTAGTCVVCDQTSPLNKDNGGPSLEVHHVKRLADQGPDFVTNAVAACPNCHREIHYRGNREALSTLLYSKDTQTDRSLKYYNRLVKSN